MKPDHDGALRQLRELLEGAGPPAFRPGFAGRVMQQLHRHSPVEDPASLLDRWIGTLVPRVALGAACLLLLLGAWNLNSVRQGDLVTRLLQMPDLTLANGLDYEGDWTP